MKLRNVLVPLFTLLAVASMAQDRGMTVREVDVLPRKAEVDVLADGGCMLTAYATVAPPSVEPHHSRSQYAFNGARCTTVKNAIVTAAKKDLGAGNGADP